jgi:hypothetical protein
VKAQWRLHERRKYKGPDAPNHDLLAMTAQERKDACRSALLQVYDAPCRASLLPVRCSSCDQHEIISEAASSRVSHWMRSGSKYAHSFSSFAAFLHVHCLFNLAILVGIYAGVPILVVSMYFEVLDMAEATR